MLYLKHYFKHISSSSWFLGLSPESRKLLIDEVDIVYNAAASVRFDDPLKDAILMNTRSTREVVYLAREMKHLDVLVHVSTTYCNTDKQVIGTLADLRVLNKCSRSYFFEIDFYYTILIVSSVLGH